MEKGGIYVFLVLMLGIFLLISFTDFNETPKLTGRVIDGNETNETCTEDWSCVDWGDCVNETQPRTCTDINDCGTDVDKPEESQSCVVENVTCTEDWSCVDWGDCVNETQPRTCTDINDCGTDVDKPEESQSCVVENVTCTEDWSCVDWGACDNEVQTRTCTDVSTCSTELEKPNITQSCVVENVTCTEDWSCDGWDDCSSETQTRTCTDTNDCGTEVDKPDESQTCTVEEETTDDTDTTNDDNIVISPPAPTPPPTPTPSTPKETPKEPSGSDVLTGQAINIFNETNCTGCLLNDRCYDFNKTKKGKYCLEDGTWVEQVSFNETCINDFECDSNSCLEEGLCAEKSVLQKFFEWFINLFQFDFSSEVNQTNSTNNETLKL